MHILLVKESRAGEKRVALLPEDAEKIVRAGHRLFMETGAGEFLGIPDEAYQKLGVKIRTDFKLNPQIFHDIALLIRVKRPDREREAEEWKFFPAQMSMLGALDPYEKNSPHITEYRKARIQAYSLDQIPLPKDHPMNMLAGMSHITGRLAMQDAWQRSSRVSISTILLIGFGTLGQSALKMARELAPQASIYVTATREAQLEKIRAKKASPILISKDMPLDQQKKILSPYVRQSDIILSSARQSGQKAPVLIDEAMLQSLKKGTVILDLALSEGGNVLGSKHDAQIDLAHGAIIANISGYPKAEPLEASQVWSRASQTFVELFSKDPADPLLKAGLVS